MNACNSKRALGFLRLLLSCMLAQQAFCAGSPQGRLEKMALESDLGFKGQVISDSAITNTAFPDWGKPHVTEFNVISVFRGNIHTNVVTFLHITGGPMTWGGPRPPQPFVFDVGRSYLIFGMQSNKADWLYSPSPNVVTKPNEIRQIMSGEIPIRTLDARPLGNLSTKDAHWFELNLLLNDVNSTNQLYAIDQLDGMSLSGRGNDAWSRSDDFNRADVLSALLPLINSSNDQVACRAISCFETESKSAIGLETFAAALIKVANESPSSNSRLTAIGALSGLHGEAVSNSLAQLLKNTDENIRLGAVRLLPRFPDEFAEQFLRICADDESSKVRAVVAETIGNGKIKTLLPTLEKLWNDPIGRDKPLLIDLSNLKAGGHVSSPQNIGDVHTSTGYALLQFDLDLVGEFLKANLSDEGFGLSFIRKLAPNGAEPYLPMLAQELKTHTANSEQEAAKNGFHWGLSYWLSGNFAWAWDTLFAYVSTQTREDLADPKMAPMLDALQIADDPGEDRTRSLYEFFLDKGMIERAKELRRGIIRRTEDKAIDKKSFGFPEKLKIFDKMDEKHSLKPGLGL